MVVVSITPEIAIEGLRTYAGGLGVLEADKFYAAGDMLLDYLVLTLFYRHGYVSLAFNGDKVLVGPERHERSSLESLTIEDELKVTLRGEDVYVRPLVYRRGTAKAVFFDVTCPKWAREIVDKVYQERTFEETFLAYALLAKASANYIRDFVGVENVVRVDLEESFTSLFLLAMPELRDRARLVIHTPGPWGHPVFPSSFIAREFGIFLDHDVNLTEYALSQVGEAIVVSQKQRDVLSKVFPAHAQKLRPITNGIHLGRWMNERLRAAVERGGPSLEELKAARQEARSRLLSMLRSYKEVAAEDLPIVSWTRRLARYKRPYFLVRFIEENPDVNAIFVLGGKPHPNDADGMDYARSFRRLHTTFNKVIFVHDYDVERAKLIHAGSDIELFTPFSGWEACGTSYMKAMANGVPVISSRDGGAIELIEDWKNGWLFGEDIRDFINIYTDPRAKQVDERDYAEFKDKLLKVLELYEADRERYWQISLEALRSSVGRVDSKRMMREYYLEMVARK
ncbi:MAG: glycogen/starch/alpha-glucan phosphorylase [Desulfurococcaceae archaeon]